MIGAIFPLSGAAAAIGHDAQMALETEADIINGNDNVPMLLGQGGGLPGLGGAKIKLVFADSQNNPQIARSEAQRLITEDHVVAIIGSYTSATAVTISQLCERYEIPYISADNSAPSLSQQGLQWFFRTSPTDIDFSKAMFAFFDSIGKQTGRQVHSIAIIHENSVFGTSSATVQEGLAKAAGIKVLADISYQADSPSLSVEAERLRAANADVVMPSSYTSDAILLVRSMHDVGYTPKAIVAQDAGFVDPNFYAAVGPLGNDAMSRSSFAIDATKARPAIPKVNALFQARDHKDLNDLTGRETDGFAGPGRRHKPREIHKQHGFAGGAAGHRYSRRSDDHALDRREIRFDRAEYRGHAGDPAASERRVAYRVSARRGHGPSGLERRQIMLRKEGTAR